MAKKIELSTGVTVEMREPKVKDMRLVRDISNEEDKAVKLIANLTMMVESDIDELSMKDYKKLQDAFESFL